MTTEEFNAKYKLLKQIAQGSGRSFTAQEAASGRAVLAHFLADDLIPPGAQFRDLLDRLPSRDRSKVLDILSVGSSTVVITQFLEDFESFDRWLRSRVGDRRPMVPPPETPAPRGDFTRLFEPHASLAPEPPPAASAPAPSPPRPPRDSFTELFKTPPEPMAHARPLPSPAPPPVEILRVRIPASDPVPPPAPAPPPPLPMPSWPGSVGAPKAPAPLPPLPSPKLGSPGPPPIPSAPIIRAPALDSLPPPAPVAGWGGESDYTRQLRPVPAPIDSLPPPAALAPPDAASGVKEKQPGAASSVVPLLLVLNIIVIIATGVILYFALKKP